MSTVAEEFTPDTARRQLVERLTAKGHLTRPDVAAAFLAVPRHEFAPAGTSVEAAYADDVVVTKKNAEGRPRVRSPLRGCRRTCWKPPSCGRARGCWKSAPGATTLR